MPTFNHDNDPQPSIGTPGPGGDQPASPTLNLSHQNAPKQLTLAPLTMVSAEELAYALPSGASRMADLRQKLEQREQDRMALRLRLPEIGTVRQVMTGGEDPLVVQAPIYGLLTVEGQDPNTVQVLMPTVGGPAWVNHNREDITLNPVLTNLAPIASKEGEGGLVVLSPSFVNGEPNEGYYLTLFPPEASAPGTFWYQDLPNAKEAMESLAKGSDMVDQAKRWAENRLQADIQHTAGPNAEKIQFFLSHLQYRGVGQIRQIQYTETPRAALEVLGIGMTLDPAHWKALGDLKPDLEEVLDGINEKLPDGSHLFFDYDRTYSEQPALYYKDTRRTATPESPIQEGTIMVGIEDLGVTVQNHLGQSVWLQGDDAITSVRHGLDFDRVPDFENGWQVTGPDPGYEFPEPKASQS